MPHTIPTHQGDGDPVAPERSQVGRPDLPSQLMRRLPWLRRRRLAACAREARRCAEELAREAAATEPEFVALGRNLREQYESATALTSVVETATGRLHDRLTGQRIAGADGVVASTLRSVETGIQDVDSLLARARTVNSSLGALSDEVLAFGKTGVLLQSVAVGFAVEASRTPECQAAFGSFVDEIRTLSQRTKDIEQSISASLAAACTTGNTVLDRITRDLVELRRLVPRLGETTDRAAARTQSRIDGLVTELSAMAERTRAIGRHTGDAVFHMQFGDLVRQKIEHVVDALHTAAGQFDRGTADLPAGVRSLEIQIGQLELVEGELHSAAQRLRGAFVSVGEAATGLDQSAPARIGGGDQGFRELLSEFGELQQLLAQASAMQQQAIDAGHESFAAASRIAERMQEVQAVNREMHLLALNAIVKTAALGTAGATLEVLSVQVHELYRQADAVVTTIGAEARKLGERNVVADTLSAAAPEEASRALATALEAVGQGTVEYTTATDQLAPQVHAHGEQLATATARLASLSSFAERLQTLRGRLLALRDTVAPFVSGTPVALPETADSGRYTMQSERAVHERIAASRTATAPEQPAPPLSTEQTATNQPVAASSAPVAGSTENLGDNVELF